LPLTSSAGVGWVFLDGEEADIGIGRGRLGIAGGFELNSMLDCRSRSTLPKTFLWVIKGGAGDRQLIGPPLPLDQPVIRRISGGLASLAGDGGVICVRRPAPDGRGELRWETMLYPKMAGRCGRSAARRKKRPCGQKQRRTRIDN
jgi:hypothetical protein